MKKRWDEAIDRGKPGMKSCNAWAISCLIHGTSLVWEDWLKTNDPLPKLDNLKGKWVFLGYVLTCEI